MLKKKNPSNVSPTQQISCFVFFYTEAAFLAFTLPSKLLVVTYPRDHEARLIEASSSCRGKDGDISCHCCCVLRASRNENNSQRIYSPCHTLSHSTEDSITGALQVLEMLLSMSIHSITPRLSVNKLFYPYTYLSHLLSFPDNAMASSRGESSTVSYSRYSFSIRDQINIPEGAIP